MPAVVREKEDSESSSEDEHGEHPCIAWSGISRTIPVIVFLPEAVVSKNRRICSVGERYNMSFKIVRTDSRLVRRILMNHGFHEVHPNSNNFNLMWTGSHLKPYLLHSLQEFQKVNHFPRSYELTRKDHLYKNIQRMQQTYGFKNFHIIPQTFVLPSESEEFRSCFAKDKGPWIIKPVASSRGRGIYLVSNPNQILMDENVLVSRYINNPLLIDEFKFDVRLYVVVTSFNPLLIYVYEEGLARFATVKYDQTTTHIKNNFMHLTNYSLNKKSSDYVSCDDPEVEDYGNKWSMSAVLRYLKEEGKDTTLLMRQVEDLIIKAVLSAELQIATACKMFVPHKANCFELYGFDVLIDSNLKPWLLEVNLSPSLSCDAPLDLKIKASMIADMLSLVGLVGQDPLLKQPRSDRFTIDKKGGPRLQHRTVSAVSSETNGDKQKTKSLEESTLNLTTEEIKVLRRIREEYERRGGFIRIFPTQDTWELYGAYLESKPSLNSLLAKRLFHGRPMNRNTHLMADTIRGRHVVQYERKLLSLEAQKRKERHLSHHTATRRKKRRKESKAFLAENRSPETEECSQEEIEEVKQPLEPLPLKVLVMEQSKQAATPLEQSHNKPESSSDAAVQNARPAVNLLNVLQQGRDLSKVQARMAFSSYLQRVQCRLLVESKTNSIPTWPDDDNDQMELVIRFLKRAAINLQQDINIVLPNHQLPLQDRRRILSFQLGEFIHCYNKETELMSKQESGEEEHCVNESVFQEYITEASENDLEEVLTYYTHRNKSANVFLGNKVRSVKAQDSGSRANSKTLPVTKEDSRASESSLSAGKVCSDPNVKYSETQLLVLHSDQQAEVTASKTQPDVRSSQHCSGFSPSSDCANIHPQHCSPTTKSIPLHCPPPPPPPQPPSYAQSLAKSNFCHSETLSDPPAYTSAPVITQPPKVNRTPASTASNGASAVPPSQALRKIQSVTTPTTNSKTTFAVLSAMPIYSQTFSRPTSAHQGMYRSRSKPKSNSEGTLRDLQSLSAQAQSNQQAFISALQKLADKQVARHYASSSHINLLTHHLTNLNLANKVVGRESHTLTPKAAAIHKPVRTAQAGKDYLASTGPPQTQAAPNVVMGLNSTQSSQSTKGSYQLQFAIQQLQQQRLKTHQFLDRDHPRHQIQFHDQTSSPHPQVSTKPSSCPPSSLHVRSSPNHSQTNVSPAFAPKPPSSALEGQGRKTATKRLIKQMSSESSASGSMSSSQQVVYEAICGKTGFPAYGRLFQVQEPSHR
ncbi:tubulin polyglutamylase TTLL5 isoform X1 [Poecilia latipinna]|nr:PREDICTED: tubulin polyglutamylase TTLL5 isoform X1 [Poecilia latipinna]XP_014891828.1 PREDICTED: tubulin polyglutamylase TTLL5 isoform X1 [Poecilia latipinna]XP_014891830.1 PREDICTED: tubulin polyglutamylase TTLL5 isoform X1 [Poecilia latipinna]XP_014891831.1 PREDICTED: tubulin polyglutamylase TTLL5 isoform X1 [Poecilia latipinna]XP_014891832.1 PREDICTED: tubulin polyglutamylase TTLL5 isoform X1 [Poecilia latipinna]XP_014891833.1 PREDICTED: tubulin polyglutamylase TTLL5 isoform X1 [Poecili